MVIGELTSGPPPVELVKPKPQITESAGISANPVLKTEPIVDAETILPHYAQYRDLFAPPCLEELTEKLTGSQGKAFFIVHPFYLVNTWSQSYIEDAFQGRINDKQMVNFFQRMKETIPKLIEAGVPVIVLQELEQRGTYQLEDEKQIKIQYEQFCRYLQQISDKIDPKSLFIMYTERGGPNPLKGKSEEKTGWLEVIGDRMESLKKAGLVTGIVAGREFKPSDGGPR